MYLPTDGVALAAPHTKGSPNWQSTTITRFSAKLLSSAFPDDLGTLGQYFQRFSASTIMSILYDYPTFENDDDETLKQIHKFISRRAQAELDAIVGHARPPTFSDLSSLHNIQADVWYDGMFIPNGSMCISNLWQCHHDPAFYGDNAAQFNPERFLENGRLSQGPAETSDDGHTTVLRAANLESVRDQNGKGVTPDTETFVDTRMVL
ncbi:cytochrome P450 [Lactarius vividus]|nr:cytochrome P450 [Lactarius vividus]